MCTHGNPRPLPEIEAALVNNRAAERDHEAMGFDLGDILLEREYLHIERQSRIENDGLDNDGHPIGAADTPPAIGIGGRLTLVHLHSLRLKQRVIHDPQALYLVDIALAEIEALRKELGLPEFTEAA